MKVLNDVKLGCAVPFSRRIRRGCSVAVVAIGIVLCGPVYADPVQSPTVHVSGVVSTDSTNGVSGGTATASPEPEGLPFVELAAPDNGTGGSDADDSGSDYLMHIQLAQVADDDVNDPLEGFNRGVFAFNELVYAGILGPVADVYNVLPSEARTAVSNFFSNLKGPLIFINDLLQGEIMRALNTLTRFALNSTIGVVGFADVASTVGLEGHKEDFGQTLAVWGVGEGFYLVLPILGPSNPRDAVGQYVVDTLIDPVNIYLDNHDESNYKVIRAAAAGFTGFAGIRDDLVALKENSVDYYAAVRSLYRQRRAVEIANGTNIDLPVVPDFDSSDLPGESDDPEPATSDITNEDPSSGEPPQVAVLSVIQPYAKNPFETHFRPVHGPGAGDSVPSF